MPTIFERDNVNAFCKHAPIEILSNADGPLKNLSFAVKDNYDIAGVPTAFGSPAWLNSHPIPTQTAHFIPRLIAAGASLLGKTHTDELTYSILGMNAHFGTPVNSAAPDRVPGGSSSGSAAAVAANLVDFAIGSDTGGSVRAPASFCGIYGFRPTHGLISLTEARPLAKSFDTLGWFSKDPQLMLKIGELLLPKLPSSDSPNYSYLEEAFALLPKPIAIEAKQTIANYLNQKSIPSVSIGHEKLSDWTEIFRIIQGYEAWNEHGTWVESHLNQIGPGIRERFEAAKLITQREHDEAQQKRSRIIELMNQLLEKNQYLIIPTVTDAAPQISSTPAEFDMFRKTTFQLLCIAGLCGLPQISIPLMKVNGAPFGLSIIGGKNCDFSLLKSILRT